MPYQLPPFPIGASQSSFEWNEWYYKLQEAINSTTIEHNQLSGLQGGGGADIYHLTQTQHNDLTTNLATTISANTRSYFPAGWA